ncbi:MAG: hypothetical protein R2684_15670 [Pyrinomonadaceae bacterium]
MKKLALATSFFVGLFVMAGLTTPAFGQCGTNINPTNTCTGASTGASMSTGTVNTFMGNSAGQLNTSGDSNAYFGSLSGLAGTTARRGSFFGAYSGRFNTGNNNAFFGTQSGYLNVAGTNNSFFGDASGQTNVSGNYNSAFGRGADVSVDGLTFGTAIGAGAKVTASNTLQLGRAGFDTVRVGKLGTGGTTALCLNANFEIAACPAAIASKSDDSEGLRYEFDRQAKVIRAQEAALREQQGQIEALKNTICSMNRNAPICKQ